MDQEVFFPHEFKFSYEQKTVSRGKSRDSLANAISNHLYISYETLKSFLDKTIDKCYGHVTEILHTHCKVN